MSVPKQFEFVKTHYQFKGRPQAPVFVTVLDVFEHRYTGEKMYHIRLEHDGTFGFNAPASSFAEYKTVTEKQMAEMLLTQIKEG